ncbi:MAG: HigA family addiction module antidote protein [Chloroflexia bacterium]|nr:HigA family addiction module antidote protein [Chloroflexia bacterium]
MAMMNPPHPGRIVRTSIAALGRTVTAAAEMLHVSRPTLSSLINGKAGISPEMAVRLSKAVASTPEFWLRLQMIYDLAQVERRAAAIIVHPLPERRAVGAGDVT